MRLAIPLAILIATTVVAAATASPRHARVLVRSTSLGRVLVDESGRTLYLFAGDRTGKSACLGQCAAAWPPVVTSGAPLAGTGVQPSRLKTTRRKDGRLQVVYAGHPLYRYGGDAKAGQTNGEGVAGKWFAVTAKGGKVPPVAVSTGGGTTTTTPTVTDPYGGGGGY